MPRTPPAISSRSRPSSARSLRRAGWHRPPAGSRFRAHHFLHLIHLTLLAFVRNGAGGMIVGTTRRHGQSEEDDRDTKALQECCHRCVSQQKGLGNLESTRKGSQQAQVRSIVARSGRACQWPAWPPIQKNDHHRASAFTMFHHPHCVPPPASGLEYNASTDIERSWSGAVRRESPLALSSPRSLSTALRKSSGTVESDSIHSLILYIIQLLGPFSREVEPRCRTLGSSSCCSSVGCSLR